MKIRIGVQHSAREHEIETEITQAELAEKVAAATKEGTLLTLSDKKDRTLLIPGNQIAFVEYSSEEPRRVGFLG